MILLGLYITESYGTPETLQESKDFHAIFKSVRIFLIFTGMNWIKYSLILLVVSGFSTELKSNNPTRSASQDSATKIRVVNASDLVFTHVSLFSMKFENLQPNDTSAYQELRYDPLRDDPLIYCVNDGKNLGRYLTIPDNEIRRFTYVIDSVSNGILYVSSYRENSE